MPLRCSAVLLVDGEMQMRCAGIVGHGGKHFTIYGTPVWNDPEPIEELTLAECDDAIDKLAKAVE